MNNSIYFSLVRKDLKELLVSGKLIVLAAVFLLFGFLSPIAAKYLPDIIAGLNESQNIQIILPEPVWQDAVAQYLKNLSQLCTLITVIVFMGLIAREKESGTAVFLLVKPVSRISFLLSKYTASIINLFISLSLAFVAASFYTYLFFEGFPIPAFLKLNLVMLLYFISLVSIILMFSTLFKSQLAAGVSAFVLWMILGLLSAIPVIGEFLPAMLVTQAELMMSDGEISFKSFAGSTLIIAMSFYISNISFSKWET